MWTDGVDHGSILSHSRHLHAPAGSVSANQCIIVPTLKHVARPPAALACMVGDPASSRMSWNYLAEMVHHLLALLDQGMRLTRKSCGRLVFIGQVRIDSIRWWVDLQMYHQGMLFNLWMDASKSAAGARNIGGQAGPCSLLRKQEISP